MIQVLEPEVWRPAAADHARAVAQLTADHLARADGHRAHPVEDFLFTYYSLRPAQLARWHPGIGTALAGAEERARWRFHRVLGVGPARTIPATVTVDSGALLAARGQVVDFTERLLAHTAAAPGQFGCFGLHEWAMVHQRDPAEIRHSDYPLRLGPAGTDEVVRSHQIRCSHYDAYRFFTPAARPLNLLAPDLESRDRMEQPGCLHATMDLYKWAYKLLPAMPSELLLDCFRLARDVRELDMRASPYDLTALGYLPVPIETVAGKATYVAAQRHFAARGQQLRARLQTVISALRTEQEATEADHRRAQSSSA